MYGAAVIAGNAAAVTAGPRAGACAGACGADSDRLSDPAAGRPGAAAPAPGIAPEGAKGGRGAAP